ncbi:hypothetical protein D9619_003950 [Psilocybe cf. subviscida]|uniref:Nephrocystin 3-like N-terminal domain-containing protein n=1 Tax=Psilocybe cf. subviscida TaxID=2480587 RepID=A0A8H5BQA9_9AGAR|nr:hypothetical protein D9619_003950 [Psilocybe cf. subviscida]
MRESLLNVSGPTLINGGQFSMVNNYLTSSLPGPTSGLDRLHAQIAVAALHNALNSFESGICHPNTREVVLHGLFQFIQDDPKTRKNWILWLSGPAGSGKTTIARTLVYLCEEKGLNQASFFFCRMDLTRNGIKPLVATLAHQIACRFPVVKDMIVAAVERRPQIFDLSVEEQFRCLITEPLSNWRRREGSGKTIAHPLICVIDALDECDEDRLRNTQSSVVQALHKLVSGKDSPVIFMVASRAEPNLRMAFNRIRHSVARVYLDNSYDPSVDIRRFVVDKFEEIRAIHPLASSLPQDWPQPTSINNIVSKSSGQFIYAATVMQYVSSPWSDPAASLEIISRSVTAESSAMPFIELDNLFALILDRARSWAVVSTILSCHLLAVKLSDIWFSLLLESSGHSVKSIRPYLMDIMSLAEMDDKQQRLIIHNESLVDFLVDHRRSGRFFVDIGRASYDILMTVLRNRTRDDVHLVVDYIIALLPRVIYHSRLMGTLLLEFSREAVTIYPEPFLTEHGRRLLLDAFSNQHLVHFDSHRYKLIWSRWSAEGGHDRLARDHDAGHDRDARRDAPSVSRPASDSYFDINWSSHLFEIGRSQWATEYYGAQDISLELLHPLRPSPSPRSPAWFQNELRGIDLRDIKPILASVLISEATGMSFGAVTGILGYDAADCARILSSLPSLLEYNSEDQIIAFHHGRQLLDYMSSLDSGIYCIREKEVAIQTVIRLLSLDDSYKGNLFGDLSALLFLMKIPTPDLQSQLKRFAMRLLVSPVDVHVLDFTTFLDALAQIPSVTMLPHSVPGPIRTHHPRRPRATPIAVGSRLDRGHVDINTRSTKSSPEVTETANRHYTDTYSELLTYFVQYWASKHEHLDPLLLSVREFGRTWKEVVQTR